MMIRPNSPLFDGHFGDKSQALASVAVAEPVAGVADVLQKLVLANITNFTGGLADDFPLPSGYVQIAIENGHRNSGFSHLENGDFPVRYVSHNQRVMER
jgi:hypothetical protein